MAEVLVVGGGPTGLMMAAQLLLQGVSCRLIDEREGPTTQSRALGIQARTLEIFDALGIVDEFLEEGLPVRALNAVSRGRKLARIDFKGVDTAYPFILSLEQSKTEEILTRYLERLGGRIERSVELVSLRETAEGVETVLHKGRGQEERTWFDWVVGCDGAHSAVRKQLGFAFKGKALSDVFSLADVALENWPFPHNEAAIFFEPEGILGAIPMGGEKRYRLLFQLERCQGLLREKEAIHGPFQSEKIPAPTLEEAQEIVSRYTDPSVRVVDPAWMAHFHIHSRMIENFRKGRVFLAGDAAHIHSPAGGQGMNTGLQDAFNLAWKLALVHRKEAPEALLDTYDGERREVAAQILKGTEAATRMATARGRLIIGLRNWVVSHLLKSSWIRSRIARTVSQIATRYPISPIANGSSSFRGGPVPGTRVPNVVFFGEKGEVDLYTLLSKSSAHYLLLITGPRPAAKRIEAFSALGKSLNFPVSLLLIAHDAVAPSLGSIRSVADPDGAAHQLFGAEGEAAYLIRPDLIVGYRCKPIDEAGLSRYGKWDG